MEHYYHGSYSEIAVGTILAGRNHRLSAPSSSKDDRLAESDSAVYKRLDAIRPKGCIPRDEAVFMVSGDRSNDFGLDDIDALGGATDYVLTVRPNGVVQRYDQSLLSLAECKMEDGQKDEADGFLRAYWNGEASDCPVWEYLTESAVVSSSQPFESAVPVDMDNGTFVVSNLDAGIPDAENEGGYCIADFRHGQIKALACVKDGDIRILKTGLETAAVSQGDLVTFRNIDNIHSPYRKLCQDVNDGKRTARIVAVVGAALPYTKRGFRCEFLNKRGQISQHSPEFPSTYIVKAGPNDSIERIKSLFSAICNPKKAVIAKDASLSL